ncbi:MAG: hypothetical protein AB7W16_26310 [Candidatus Obscuribacterales bacterium]
MSFVIPGEYENEERFERELAIERDEARKILMDSGLVSRVEFTNCMIPIQIHAFLPTEEMCYGRNSRVGGNVTMWVFEKECKLAKGWPPPLFKGEQVSNATTYIILAQEMLVLIKKYLELKSEENAVAT